MALVILSPSFCGILEGSMANDSEELLGLFDEGIFHSIRVDISISNSTTRTEFKKEPAITIVEFNDDGLVIESPAKCCASNHSLVLKMRAAPPTGESIEVIATAKVNEIEQAQDGIERLTLNLVQVHEADWNRFKSLFAARQDEINNFLTSSRGY
jgi:hypothetical protein